SKITPRISQTMAAKLGRLQSRAKISSLVSIKKITGSEKFPGKRHAKSHISHLDDKTVRILARYYTKVYGFTFYAACDPKQDQNAIRVSNMVERFAAIQLGDEIFGSRVSRSDLRKVPEVLENPVYKEKETNDPAKLTAKQVELEDRVRTLVNQLAIREVMTSSSTSKEKDTSFHKFWNEVVEKDGPIEPNTPHDQIRKEPYILPKEFEWSTMELNSQEK
ncbi:12281_t:CDS:2, partial [Ambispora leptoticha]